MRIVRLDETGPPENLAIVEVPIPVPSRSEVLIRTAFAGIIFGDMEARRGTYFKATKLPFFPGREVAGEIVAVGENVEHLAPGDRVLALVMTGGCWADYVVADTSATIGGDGRTTPASDIVKLPANVSYVDALPYLINFRLAHMLFHGSSRVPTGATVLIHGGSGGMGSMLIQLAREHNCTIITTSRTETEGKYCQDLGADHVILSTQHDYVLGVRQLTGGRGVPFSFNGVGGDTLNRDFDVLTSFGELQAYGYVAGKTPFDAFRLGKTITLKTFSADDYLPTEMFAEATRAMGNWFKNSPLRGIDSVFPLADVVKANRLLDNGGVLGKMALQP